MAQRLLVRVGFWATSFLATLALQGTSAIAIPTELLNQPGNLIDLPNLRLTRPADPTNPQNSTSDSANPDSQTLRLEIQLSRRQVTVYRADTVLKRYPIAIGRPGWETPTGTYQVLQKLKNPTWVNPLKQGIVIPGGDPENPLGRYWIGFWTNGKNWIGFHGTPNPRSVGTAASHGCIRMYNKDIEELFQKVSLGTVVTVVD